MEIGILRRQGLSLREIAVATGVAVNTVRTHLAEGGKPRYGPREPRVSKLDPYKGYLASRVEAARPDWIPATVLARRETTGSLLDLAPICAANHQMRDCMMP